MDCCHKAVPLMRSLMSHNGFVSAQNTMLCKCNVNTFHCLVCVNCKMSHYNGFVSALLHTQREKYVYKSFQLPLFHENKCKMSNNNGFVPAMHCTEHILNKFEGENKSVSTVLYQLYKPN